MSSIMAEAKELGIKEHGIRMWDGYELHPVMAEFERLLTGTGFVRVYGGPDRQGYFEWSRSAFAEIEHFVAVSPGTSPRGSVQFSIAVGGISSQYRDVQNALKCWECNPEREALFPTEPLLEPQQMVRVSLHWLLLNADPSVRRLQWEATAKTSISDARSAFEDLTHYGFRFLKEIDTRDKLIHLLQNIHSYPKKTPAPGPISPEPSVCAALLLYLKGDVEAALQELEIGYQTDIARHHRTWAGNEKALQEAISFSKCKTDRYRSFFLRETAPGPISGTDSSNRL